MAISGTYNLVANPTWKNLVLQEIYLECDTTLAPVTINLFPISDLGRFWNVKIYVTDISNNAGTNPITINAGSSGLPLVSDTINRQGLTNFTINYNGGDAVLMVVTGNKWSAFSQTILAQTGLTYKGAWDANSNTPTLTSGVGTGGDYYIVSVAGNTNLDGVIDWQVGDWAIFEDATNMWQKIDNHDVQAYNTIQKEGVDLPQRSIINFTGAGVNAFDIAGKTEVNITGVSSGNFGLFSQTASSAPITNTTVETSLLDGGVGTLSVPPNGFNVGDSFLAIMSGYLNSANNQQLEIRIRSNGSLLADTGIITLNTATNRDFNLQIYFTIQAIGGAGVASIVTGGNFAYTKNASTTLEGTAFSTRNNTTFNTTVLNTLVISAQWGASNPNNIIYSDIFTLTKTF
jgi:hypothetical protein